MLEDASLATPQLANDAALNFADRIEKLIATNSIKWRCRLVDIFLIKPLSSQKTQAEPSQLKERNNMLHRHSILVTFLLVATWLDVSAVRSESLSLGDDGYCPDQPTRNEPCKTIRSWGEFVRIVQAASKRLVLCPFQIDKGAEGPAVITKHVHLVCQNPNPNQCVIDGIGSHVHVKGGNAKVIIQGLSFRDATNTAVKVWSSSTSLQAICNCQFIRNHASIRGGGLKAEKGTNIYIEGSSFDGNKSNQGGAIYNRGDLTIVRSRFIENEGRMGGGIRSIAHASVHLLGNEFVSNRATGFEKRGPVIYVEDLSSLNLLPGNVASGNVGNCDGVFTAVARECITFEASPTRDPAVSPPTANDDAFCPGSPPAVSGTVPKGHFTYNLASSYGPQNWHKVDVTRNEWTKYRGLPAGINQCGGKLQSPIDLGGRPTANCEAHHEIRTRRGDLGIDHRAVSFSITPTRLRIDFKRRWAKEPDLPSCDLPNGFGIIDAKHVEVRIPSEHTFEGKHLDGEYTIAHVQDKKKRIVMVSILIKASGGRRNPAFQMLLDKWKSVAACGLGGGKRRLESAPQIVGGSSGNTSSSSNSSIEEEWSNHTIIGEGSGSRYLQANNKQFDIYHPDLMPSIHFHAYKGSLTQPPCLGNVHWRVMDKPMVISPSQLQQMAKLLTEGVCRDEQAALGLGGCLARPIQDSDGRQYWRCDRSDFLSDCVRFGRNCD